MKNSILLICRLSVIAALLTVGCRPAGTDIVRPNKIQQNWADAEIGVLIHFDMQVYEPDYNWRKYGSHPDPDTFNPVDLDTDQWLEAASKLGAKYAVLVAKHGSGFSLWPTEAHDYSVKNSSWRDGKGDIVADFVASCKKYGIKPGIYANTNANGYLHTDRGIVAEGGPVSQVEYNAVVAKQLTELWSNYGDLFEIWFDGGVLTPKEGGADVLPLVKKLQPDAIAFQGPLGHENLIRWVGNERGTAPDPCWATADSTTNSDGVKIIEGLHGSPDAPFWCPGESDFTLRYNSSYGGGWMWKAGEDNLIFSVDELMEKYETSVGRNTNMLLGIVIDDHGLVPEADVKRMEEFGNEIRRQYGTPAAETSGDGNKITLRLQSPALVDRVILQEDIAEGERVLTWHLEGTTPSGEKLTLCEGTNIGHKRIARFYPAELVSLRFVADSYKAKPLIRRFAAFQADPERLVNLRKEIQPVPRTAVMKDDNYFIWCGTMVKHKDTYHLFYSRWEKKYGFQAWVTRSEIAHATAPTPFGPFTHKDVALPARGSEYWDGLCTHNPTAYKFGSKYYLYYMGNTGDGDDTPGFNGVLNWNHRNNQRIGVAVADTPDGPWKRFDKPIIDASEDPDAPDALMASNPAITQGPDGKYLMVYKAVGKKKPLPFGGPVVHLSAVSDSPTGPFVKDLKPIFTAGEAQFPAEDPFIWSQFGKYFAIVKDQGGYFIKHDTRALVLFESDNGKDWSIAPDGYITDVYLRWDDGKVEKMHNLERPQLFFENGKPVCLLAAVAKEDMSETYIVQIPLK